MKKINLLILCSFALISCGTNFKSGITNLCADLNNLPEKKLSKINIPDTIGNSPYPNKDGYKQFDDTNMVGPHVEGLKNNMFVAAYNYVNPGDANNNINSDLLVGKIFNQNGEETVNRFKIAEYKGLGKFKLITNKNLDYFWVFYEITNYEQNSNNNLIGYYIKKFDLNGNQLNEIKLDSSESRELFKGGNFLFDENGNNLILSWVSLKYSHTDEHKCPFIFPCVVPAISPTSSYRSVIHIIKFDENLNYCLTKIGFDELIQANTVSFPLPYISRNRETVLFPLTSNNIKQINIKDNSAKVINLGTGISDYDLNIVEDEENNFYFIGMYFIYKTDSQFRSIKTKVIDRLNLPKTDISTINDRIDSGYDFFINKELDVFGYPENYFLDKERVIELDNKTLFVNKNYFRVVDKLNS